MLLSAQGGGRERPQRIEQGLIHLRVAGNDIGTEGVLQARGSADATAGLLNQQRPGRGVPGGQAEFPKAVDAAGRHIGEIQRGRSRPAHARGGGHDHLQHGEIFVDMGAGTKREASADQGAFQGALRAHPDFLAFELCAVAARGGKEFLTQGIVHDGVLQAALVLERYRDRQRQETMHEIRRVIDPSHPGNIGSVARAMKNMALSDLVLVRPRSFPHVEANALAAGADDILSSARIVATVAEAIGDCGFIAGTTSRPRSYYWEFTTPRDVAGRIVGLPEENRAALLFGSERYGLATEDLNHCNVLVRIPANPEYCSLNLAMSVQLLSYEIFMSRERPQSHTQLELPLAPSGDVEHFYAHLHQVLNEIDFDDRTGHLMERLRRLFNRAQLDRNELNILRGILSAVQGRRGQSAQRPRDERGGTNERD